MTPRGPRGTVIYILELVIVGVVISRSRMPARPLPRLLERHADLDACRLCPSGLSAIWHSRLAGDIVAAMAAGPPTDIADAAVVIRS